MKAKCSASVKALISILCCSFLKKTFFLLLSCFSINIHKVGLTLDMEKTLCKSILFLFIFSFNYSWNFIAAIKPFYASWSKHFIGQSHYRDEAIKSRHVLNDSKIDKLNEHFNQAQSFFSFPKNIKFFVILEKLDRLKAISRKNEGKGDKVKIRDIFNANSRVRSNRLNFRRKSLFRQCAFLRLEHVVTWLENEKTKFSYPIFSSCLEAIHRSVKYKRLLHLERNEKSVFRYFAKKT